MPDPTLLDVSRWQFAVTAAFHMTFPALTVGLAVFLAVVYTIYARTGDRRYLQIFRFWRKIFAVGFGLGVVAGTVMTFEFGLNWGGYADAVGPILGVTIGMEVVTAFFLEAGFIGILLYGDGRASTRVMTFAAWMVALGTLFSTTWILSANSWMQTPAGYEVVDGQFRPTDWWEALLNPAFTYRFPHMLLAVLISAGWFLAGISAYYLVKQHFVEFAKPVFSAALGVVALLLPLQFHLGDGLTSFMAGAQPPKFLALEGNWGSTNTGYNLIVVPDIAEGRNLVQIAIPEVGSYIAKDLSGNTPTPGLLEAPRDEWPNVWAVFYGFRVMFFCALLMFAIALMAVVQRLRGTLHTNRWFHKWVLWMAPIGPIAVVGGWVTSESGRQPWVVYGQLLTRDAVSPLAPSTVVASFTVFVALYLALLVVWIAYVVRTVRHGPDPADLEPEPDPLPARAKTAASPPSTSPVLTAVGAGALDGVPGLDR